MRWTHATVIVIFIAVIVVFALQNLQSVTVSFLNFNMSAPLALIAVLVYGLGMITGGSVWSLIRWAMQGVRPEQIS
jgi:putative membrane protein